MSELKPISVVMSVYNGSRYLRESVESILAQSFTDFEFIILDDGSTDSTWKILSEYAQQDQRIRLYQNEENIGLTKSLNKGMNLAQGKYIARQDADDVSLPNRFEKQVARLDCPEVVLVSCDLEIINAQGKTVSKYQRACDRNLVPWYLLFHNRLAGHSQVMFKREPVLQLGGYSSDRRYSQDYELWCRLVKVGKIEILPEVLQKQRLHGESVSVKKGSEQKAYSLNQVRDNIKQLTGLEISLEDAAELKGFWTGYWWPDHFPPSHRASWMHSSLKQTYQGFLQQSWLAAEPKSVDRLRLVIGEQFLRWIQAPGTQKRSLPKLLAKLNISYFALAWHPQGVADSWSRLVWRKLRK